jgi:hypothetical protein
MAGDVLGDHRLSLGCRLGAASRVLDRQHGVRGLDPAVVDPDQLAGPVLAQPQAAVGQPVEPHPGPVAQPVLVTRHGLDHHVALQPGDPAQLLLHDARLEPALGRDVDVLEVAAATPARAGVGARPDHTVRRLLVDRHRVPAQEPVADRPLGQPDRHPLARERVPHEDDDPADVGHLRRQPRDAGAAVREGADLDLVLGADHRATAGRPLPGPVPGVLTPHGRSSSLSPDQLRNVRLVFTCSSCRSARSSPICDDWSW